MYIIASILVCLSILSFTFILDPVYKNNENRFLTGSMLLLCPILWSLPTLTLESRLHINAFALFSIFMLVLTLIWCRGVTLKLLGLIIFSGMAFFISMIILTFLSVRIPQWILAVILGTLCMYISDGVTEGFVFGLNAIWIFELVAGIWDIFGSKGVSFDFASMTPYAAMCGICTFSLKCFAGILTNAKCKIHNAQLKKKNQSVFQ